MKCKEKKKNDNFFGISIWCSVWLAQLDIGEESISELEDYRKWYTTLSRKINMWKILWMLRIELDSIPMFNRD